MFEKLEWYMDQQLTETKKRYLVKICDMASNFLVFTGNRDVCEFLNEEKFGATLDVFSCSIRDLKLGHFNCNTPYHLNYDYENPYSMGLMHLRNYTVFGHENKLIGYYLSIIVEYISTNYEDGLLNDYFEDQEVRFLIDEIGKFISFKKPFHIENDKIELYLKYMYLYEKFGLLFVNIRLSLIFRKNQFGTNCKGFQQISS